MITEWRRAAPLGESGLGIPVACSFGLAPRRHDGDALLNDGLDVLVTAVRRAA